MNLEGFSFIPGIYLHFKGAQAAHSSSGLYEALYLVEDVSSNFPHPIPLVVYRDVNTLQVYARAYYEFFGDAPPADTGVTTCEAKPRFRLVGDDDTTEIVHAAYAMADTLKRMGLPHAFWIFYEDNRVVCQTGKVDGATPGLDRSKLVLPKEPLTQITAAIHAMHITTILQSLTQDERADVMGEVNATFCKECWRQQPASGSSCQCWNDE